MYKKNPERGFPRSGFYIVGICVLDDQKNSIFLKKIPKNLLTN